MGGRGDKPQLTAGVTVAYTKPAKTSQVFTDSVGGGDKPQLTEGGTVAYTRPTKPLSVRCTTLCDKVCQRLATGWWFSLGPPVSSTNKTDRHNIIAILLKVALSTIKQTNKTSLKV